MKRPEPARVQALIREVIGAHPEDYVSGDGWQEQSVNMLKSMIANPIYQSYLSELFRGLPNDREPMERQDRAEMEKAQGIVPEAPSPDDRRLGF
jgi:hypothetical protein